MVQKKIKELSLNEEDHPPPLISFEHCLRDEEEREYSLFATTFYDNARISRWRKAPYAYIEYLIEYLTTTSK